MATPREQGTRFLHSSQLQFRFIMQLLCLNIINFGGVACTYSSIQSSDGILPPPSPSPSSPSFRSSLLPLPPSLSPFLPFLLSPSPLPPSLPSLFPFTLYIRLCGLATLALVVLATWTTLSLTESHHHCILQNTIQKNWHTCPTPSSSETTQTCFHTYSSKVREHQIWMHLGELTHSLG